MRYSTVQDILRNAGTAPCAKCGYGVGKSNENLIDIDLRTQFPPPLLNLLRKDNVRIATLNLRKQQRNDSADHATPKEDCEDGGRKDGVVNMIWGRDDRQYDVRRREEKR